MDEPWQKIFTWRARQHQDCELEQAQGFVNVHPNLAIVFMRPQMHVVSLVQKFGRYRVSRMDYSVTRCMSCR